MPQQVIVVGGGLSGLSAAHTVLQDGLSVVLIDKNAFLGGNSTKATSGINGAGTDTQKAHNVPDTKEIFEEDTARSATGKKTGPAPPSYALGRVLTHNSGAAVHWLRDSFGLNLDKVSRLGGHSHPRTHRSGTGGKFPGMQITFALMEALDDIAKADPSKARVINKARVTKLLTAADGTVNGVEYETRDGKVGQESGPVVVASGGYGAGGLSKGSLLHDVRPDLVNLPTTNGEHCTGDGISFSQAIGAGAVDLKHVQVHPTGLVHPKDPDAAVKFLAAEALRGEGGIILNKRGERFVNELGTRDHVTGEMWKNASSPYFLILNGKASGNIAWHCKHYVGRGIMQKVNSGEELAKVVGAPVSTIKKSFADYNEYAKAGKDPYAKKFFPALPLKFDDFFHVAVITPVVHYTMGGLYIDEDAQVLTPEGAKVPGLYAAGEVTGGVHGKNRLGGSALLECVVYGRVSGAAVARDVKAGVWQANGAAPAGGAGGIVVTVAQPNGTSVTINISGNGQVSGGAAPKSAAGKPVTGSGAGAVYDGPANAGPPPGVPGAPDAAPAEEPKEAASADKVYTMEEVAKHNTENDCWVVVKNQVLDVTKFMHDHPGGKMAIVTFAGKDATEEFEMLHEDSVISKYAPETVIGTLAPTSKL